MLASTSYVSVIEVNLSVSSELLSSVRRCFVDARNDPSSHKVVIDERGMIVGVEMKPLFTSFRERSVLMDRMSF